MKKNLFFVVFIVFLLALSGCSSGTGSSNTVGGTVYFEGTNDPIINAEIYINGSRRTTTDSEGDFWLSGLEEETTYRLEVSKDGFIPYADLITAADSSLEIYLELEDSAATYISGRVNLNNNTRYDQDYFLNNLSSNSIMWQSDGLDDYIADEIIIKFKDQEQMQILSSDSEFALLQHTAEINSTQGKTVKYKLQPGQSVEEVIAELENKPGIEYAEPNYRVYAQAQPNDPDYRNNQWNLVNANLEAAWDLETHSNSVVVAVIDSGVLPEHPDLNNNLLNGANFAGDSSSGDPADYYPTDFDVVDRTSEINGGSHGTMVAGIIGAETNNFEGIAGVSWGVDIIPIKALEGTSGTAFDVAEAIYYAAARGANVINLSLGNEFNATYLREAVEAAAAEGIIIVAAAGNDGGSVYYPAAYPEVIAVGAHDENYRLTDFSNRGSNLDLTAPGRSIYSTWGYYEDGRVYHDYGSGRGTSLAAAHVSGTAALLLESGVSSSNVKDRLLNYTNTMFADYDSRDQGEGALDAYAALLGRDLGPVRVYLSEENNRFGDWSLPSAEVGPQGEFEIIADLTEGYYYLTAHRNAGGDSVSQIGDYFGVSEQIYFNRGGYYNNIEIDLYYVTDDQEIFIASDFEK